MRRIAAISVLLVFCGFVMADQDDIDLDPANGKWVVDGTLPYPGNRGEIRDDLLSMPAGWERAICYKLSPNGNVKAASKLRYVVKVGPKPEDYRTVTITDKDGSESGVRVRWYDYIINKTCDHAAPDDCKHSGIPPELWGEFVDDMVLVKDKGSGTWYSITSKIQIQQVATGGACSAF